MKHPEALVVCLLCFSLLAPTTRAKMRKPSRQERTSAGPCANPEANELYSKGHNTFPAGGYGTPAVIAAAGKALAYFELAVEKDSKCAQAYVALAQAYARFPSWPGLPPKERFPKIKATATKAIELDDGLVAAHLLLGVAEFNSWHWEQAEKEFKRAVQLGPTDASTHASYARFLAALGRFEAAISEIEQARKLAAGSSRFDVAAGEVYYWARSYDRAIELLVPVVKSDPIAYFLLGWAYVGKSRWPEAIVAFENSVTLSDRDAGTLMSLAYAYAAVGRREEVFKFLEEVKEKTTRMYVPVYRVAAVYLVLGDKEQAFEWLEKAYRDDSSWMIWIKVDPVMDPLRDNPRFRDLLGRTHFPE